MPVVLGSLDGQAGGLSSDTKMGSGALSAAPRGAGVVPDGRCQHGGAVRVQRQCPAHDQPRVAAQEQGRPRLTRPDSTRWGDQHRKLFMIAFPADVPCRRLPPQIHLVPSSALRPLDHGGPLPRGYLLGKRALRCPQRHHRLTSFDPISPQRRDVAAPIHIGVPVGLGQLIAPPPARGTVTGRKPAPHRALGNRQRGRGRRTSALITAPPARLFRVAPPASREPPG